MLTDPWPLRGRTAPSRVLFGPHVTNLARGRSISDRHAAYYERRARGGAGVIVTETASVHESDWPYERAPFAQLSADGYRAVANAVHSHGALVLASLGHAGLQGSTAYSQGVLWAPSLVANVLTHEMPIVIDENEIAQLVRGFADATSLVVDAGLDGVEINAGQFSLLRQFMSGLTNQRDDRYGDRVALTNEVLDAVRARLDGTILGLRIVGDELAPWAGITPSLASELLARISPVVDYVVIERGSIYSEAATRPDMQAGTQINEELLVTVGASRPPSAALVAQGSIVEVSDADRLLTGGQCDAIEMTRALIADPNLIVKVRDASRGAPRPCVLCNQGCQVRDVRNPLVSCTVNPSAGYELNESDSEFGADLTDRAIVIAGGGPAGLEAARTAARRGARVTIRERSDRLGGALHLAAALPGRERWLALLDWYESELTRLGVEVQLNDNVADVAVDIDATGASVDAFSLGWRDGHDGSVITLSASEALSAAVMGQRVVVVDPIGDQIGVGLAELLVGRGASVTLITPDLVAGTQLSLTGDLVDANRRLAVASVSVVTHSAAVGVRAGAVVIEDRYTGAMELLDADVVIDASRTVAARVRTAPAIGDAVAPRTVMSAVLEARRTVDELSRVVPA